MLMGVRRKFSERGKYFRGGKIVNDGTGTSEGAENKNGTAKSVNMVYVFQVNLKVS